MCSHARPFTAPAEAFAAFRAPSEGGVLVGVDYLAVADLLPIPRWLLFADPSTTGIFTGKKKRFREAVTCSDVQVEYYQAVAGIVTSNDMQREPPRWEMTVVFKKAVDIVYGADYNQQRSILTEFFYPWDFQDREITEVPRPGEFRLFESFKLVAECKERVRITLPFTGPVMRDAPEIVGPDFIIISASHARIDYELPMVVQEEGYDTTFSVKLFGKEVCGQRELSMLSHRLCLVLESHLVTPCGLRHCQVNINTSLPYPHLLDRCSQLQINGTLHTARCWDAVSTTSIDVEMADPVLHIVKAVLPFVGALTKQLAGQPLATAAVDFVPFL